MWVHLPGSARRDLFAVDGILCALVLFRFASYLTMARHGWIAVTAAKKSVSFLAPWLLFLFLPLLTLLVVMFHVVYGSQAAEYRSYGTAFSTLLRLWRGRVSSDEVRHFYDPNRMNSNLVLLLGGRNNLHQSY